MGLGGAPASRGGVFPPEASLPSQNSQVGRRPSAPPEGLSPSPRWPVQSQPLLLDLKFLEQMLSHLQRAFQVPPTSGEQLNFGERSGDLPQATWLFTRLCGVAPAQLLTSYSPAKSSPGVIGESVNIPKVDGYCWAFTWSQQGHMSCVRMVTCHYPALTYRDSNAAVAHGFPQHPRSRLQA